MKLVRLSEHDQRNSRSQLLFLVKRSTSKLQLCLGYSVQAALPPHVFCPEGCRQSMQVCCFNRVRLFRCTPLDHNIRLTHSWL
ncbi:hypothetical protein ABKN59_006469 [Abortiporus biennis]